jgi:hypothetical protein
VARAPTHCLCLPIYAQVEVSSYFQICGHLFTSCSGGGKPQSLKKEYTQAAEEIVCLSKIQSAWSGDSSAGCGAGKVTGQMTRVGSGRSADTAEADSISGSIALRRYIELAGHLLLTASTGVEGAPVDSKHKTPATLLSISEFESDAESLLSPDPSAVQSSSPQSSPVLQFGLSPALKAWIALLAAKISLCVFNEHQRAYKWVRRALSYVVPRSSDAPKLGGMGSEGASCLAVDRCLPRLEVGQMSDVCRKVTSTSI